MTGVGNTRETLQHLERLTQDGSPFYPLETPFFSGLAMEGKLDPNKPIGRRHMIGQKLGAVCDRIVIVDFLNEEGQKACEGTPNRDLKGFLSVSVMHDSPQIDTLHRKTSHLAVTFLFRDKGEPLIFPQQSEGLMHPTLARFGGLELMQWGVHPHVTETPIKFTVRPNMVDRINSQLAALA